MTYEELRQYVLERGTAADERYLIEGIAEHTTDPETTALIEFWFASTTSQEDHHGAA